MNKNPKSQTVAMPELAAYNLFGTPEYCLPLLLDLRNGWLANERRSTLQARAIMTLNLVILNLEVMIDNKKKKI